jgi:hypothetical protein
MRIGAQRVTHLHRIAIAWGCTAAETWLRDGGFIRALGVMALNDLPGWRGPF